MKRTYIVLSITGLGLLILGYLWAEAIYRLNLHFYYDQQPYLNHVGDGYFRDMHVLGAIGAIIMIGLASYGFLHKKKALPILAVFGALLATGYMIFLNVLRAEKMLVTYSEFTQNM